MDLVALIDDIPEEYQQRFLAVHGVTPVEPDLIRAQLRRYLSAVELVAAQLQLPILEHARALAHACQGLLDGVEGGSPEHRHLAQTAARYFMWEEDDDEVTGVLGLDDDIQVINAVCRHLGRRDLIISWQPL